MDIIEDKKFAYLIIAHNEPYILEKLLSMLDDPRNDIFVLIDKKSDQGLFNHLTTIYSKIEWCKPIKINWGDVSQIKAEFILFEKAFQAGRYSYYHLLSGVDLPIKSQDEIHDFFRKKENNGKEYIRYSNYPSMNDEIQRKTRYYHFFTKFGRPRKQTTKKILNFIEAISISLQKVLKVKRKYSFDIKKGSNWCSLTENAVYLLLQNKNLILKQFKNTLCGDEIFLQSFLSHVLNHDKIINNNMRLIDWQRGNPHTFSINDIEEIKASDYFFVRKLSTSTIEYKNLVDEIYRFIHNKCIDPAD